MKLERDLNTFLPHPLINTALGFRTTRACLDKGPVLINRNMFEVRNSAHTEDQTNLIETLALLHSRRNKPAAVRD